MQEIKIYCTKCKKSMGISYIVTGNPSTPVLSNLIFKCRTCKKKSALNNYTESKMLKKIDKEQKFYL